MARRVESQRYLHGTNQQHYLIEHDNKLKCVCQLCTCGKHHCPRPRVKGTFSTSYADHYKNIKTSPSKAQSQEYKYQPRHYNLETLKTSYQDTYIPPPIPQGSPSKLESLGSKIVYQAPFIGETSYKNQYKAYQIKPMNPEEMTKIPGQIVRPQVKFDGVTSYKQHYIEPPKVAAKPLQEPVYQKAQVPFYGGSSYKNDFPVYKIEPREAITQEANYKGPHVKFDASTSYQDQYKGFQMKSPQGDLGSSRHVCVVEKLNVPPVNYINDQNHIYYNPNEKKFV